MSNQENISSKLAPLECKKCGAALPLLNAKSFQCPYCGSTEEIPESLRKAIENSQELTEKQKQAQQLFKLLGKTPGFFARKFAQINGWTLLFLFLATLPLTILFWIILFGWTVYYPIIYCYWKTFGCFFFDTAPPMTISGVLVLPCALLFILPIFMANLFRRKIKVLQSIQRALAIVPPKIKGGPAFCRNCGGPIQVPDNVLGVFCPFCSTESLVRITEQWSAKTEEGLREVGSNIIQAAKDYTRQSRKLFWTAIAQTALFTFFAFSFGLQIAIYGRNLPSWEWAMKHRMDGNTTISWLNPSRYDPKTGRRWNRIDKILPLNIPWSVQLEKQKSVADSFYVPMNNGEILTIRWGGSEFFSELNYELYLPMDPENYMEKSKLKYGFISEKNKLVFTAHGSAWYRFDILSGYSNQAEQPATGSPSVTLHATLDQNPIE